MTPNSFIKKSERAKNVFGFHAEDDHFAAVGLPGSLEEWVSVRHGAHHDAQMFTITGVPRSPTSTP